jgi:hypothetical protein
MGIDARLVKWDDSSTPSQSTPAKIDARMVKWDAPTKSADATGLEQLGNGAKSALMRLVGIPDIHTSQDVVDSGGGGVQSLRGIYDSVRQGADYVGSKITGQNAGGLSNQITGKTPNDMRRADTNAYVDSLGADRNSPKFKEAKLASDLLITYPVGGVAGKGLQLAGNALKIPSLIKLGTSVGSAGADIGMPAAKALSTQGVLNGLTRVGGSAINSGLTASLIDPDHVIQDMAIGGAFPIAAKSASAIGHGISDLSSHLFMPSPDKLALIQRANDLGIPAGLATGYDRGFAGGLKSVLNGLPILGGIGQKATDAAQVGVNRAVGRTFGAHADSLSPEVMQSAKESMGNTFDRIWGSNNLKLNPEFYQNIEAIQKQASMLPSHESARINNIIDDFLSHRVDTGNGSVIAGDVANRFQSALRGMGETAGHGFLQNDINQLRQGILTEFNKNISGHDARLLQANRMAYKNFKTIEPLMNSAEAAVAGRVSGDVPISLLPNAVHKNFSNPAGLPLTNISQVASRLLTDRIKQTGGSEKAMIQGAFKGTLLAGGGLKAFLASPMATVVAGLGAFGLQKLIHSPEFAQRMMQTGQTQQGLLDEILPMLQKAQPSLLNSN